MAKLAIKPGSTNISVYVYLQNSSSVTGAGRTGLAHNTSGLTCVYVRTRTVQSSITLVNLSSPTAAWTSGGFKEVHPSLMPGLYRLDLPNAAIATGVRSVVVMMHGAADLAPTLLEIDLINDANVEYWRAGVAPAMTGDAFARLGAPASASVSADIAVVKNSIPSVTQIADAILLRDWSAIAGTVPARSMLNALRFLRNKWRANDGVLQVYEEDDTAVAWEALLTTNAGVDRITGSAPE